MTISPVGSLAAAGSTGQSTLSVTPASIGDILAFCAVAQGAGSTVTALSGGGVTTWARATSYSDTSTNSYLDCWYGVVTAAGAATITATGLSGTTFNVLASQEFSKTDPGSWTLIAATPPGGSSGPSLGSGLAVSWPSLAASGAASYLYFGNGISVFGTLNAGSTPGFAYPSTGFTSNRPCYNPAYSGTAPTTTQTNTGAYDTVGMLIGAGTASRGGGNQGQWFLPFAGPPQTPPLWPFH